MARWQPGDHVLLEMTDLGMTFMALPVTVAWDRPDELALWFADSTPYRHRVQADGSGIPRVVPFSTFEQLDTRLVPTTVPGRAALAVIRPGRAHAVQLHWEMPGWRFRQWYVNLQTPFERSATGIRSTDQFLDIVVAPNLTWRWKDADEIEEAVRVDRLAELDAAAIWAEAQRVVAEIEAGAPPFTTEYTAWRPDPGWTIPSLRAPDAPHDS